VSLTVPVLEDDFDFEPVETGEFSFGGFELVGHGKVTNANCGVFRGFKACLNTDLHDLVTLDGVNYRGKVFVRLLHFSCDKATCPICFRSGWAVREAHKIEARLAEASKRFGKAEHIIATVPPKFYGLKYEVLRVKVVKTLTDRGVVGGVLIFHGARYNLRQSWYWSPHYHCLGFIAGGYRCRSCTAVCFKGCGGFRDRSYRCYEKDGCVVKVKGERKVLYGERTAVYNTAVYQLGHATVRSGVARFHVATWFGVCSYHKLKVTVEKHKDLCPICASDLVKVHYLGARRIVKGKGDFGYFASFTDDALAGDGSPNWCLADSGDSGVSGGGCSANWFSGSCED